MVRKTLNLVWTDFLKEPNILELQLHEQQHLYRKLTDVNHHQSGQGRGPIRDLGNVQPPHILLENGFDVLLESLGLILLEEA